MNCCTSKGPLKGSLLHIYIYIYILYINPIPFHALLHVVLLGAGGGGEEGGGGSLGVKKGRGADVEPGDGAGVGASRLGEGVPVPAFVEWLFIYLGNVCIVLELDRSLSDTYWLNVNDLSFPFVGVIEHTNMEPTEAYGGRHIVYLSRYLPESDPLCQMSDEEAVEFSLRHLGQMFPEMKGEWVLGSHVWRARYSQPIVERHYSQLLEQVDVPLDNFHIASMAQIYPEDRGTNYAVREGREAARRVMARMGRRYK